jgi:FAD/FMN-containing dehydrogenase
VPQGAFAWGREGHQTIVIVAEHYMRPETATRMRELLDPETPEEASPWAEVVAAKNKFDPQGILNPGVVKYE